ncbi:MAG: histidine phosphatase family protein [Candidatus Fervidibacter sp.]|uniref:histidine phosphatase family protein n=1 Tax=Candidatus Fervidibacter sp. TaxID=3100871 RepID=UPI00404919CE
MLKLLLVRHGESVWNEEERIQGQQDIPLSERGRKQALALGEKLKSTSIAACFSSPLIRALETAKLILNTSGNKVPITKLPELMERSFGDWEEKPISELKSQCAEEFTRWVSANYIPAPPGGESIDELLRRVERGLKLIFSHVNEGTFLLVGHSGSVKAAICVLFDLPPSSFARLKVDNTSLTVVEIKGGKPTLVHFNDTCHLK